MNKYIAYCGLDCEKCEARIATINNDNDLRKKVSEEWSKLNNVEISPEMINCTGCRIEGCKTIFCDKLCPIRICARSKGYETCGDCNDLLTCVTIKMIIEHNDYALNNLKENK